MRSGIAVCAVVVVLGLMLFAVGPTVQPQSQSRTPDDLWAEAILYSLPLEGCDSADVVHRYERAIAAADDKAAVYVSLGDFYRGPTVAGAMFAEFAAALVESQGAPSEEAEAAAGQFLAVVEGADPSLNAYIAATQADPECLPAWYRLACFAKGEVRLSACRWLQDHAPENALGWYLEAVYHAEEEDFDAVLDAVGRGNQCSTFRIYPLKYPQNLTLAYPAVYDELAGVPVPASAVAMLAKKTVAEFFQFADPMHQGVRAVVEALCDREEAHAANNDPVAVVHRAIAAHEFTVKIAAVDPPDVGITVTALGSSYESMRRLRELLPRDSAGLKAREDVHSKVVRYRDLLNTKFFDEFRKEIERHDPAEFMRGTVDPLRSEDRLLREIRAEAGFAPPTD